jgi:lysozyme
VTRDGTPPYPDSGFFGINIHRGSYNGTSSLGCQTIYPTQWDSFINLAVDQTKRYFAAAWKAKVIPYILLEE